MRTLEWDDMGVKIDGRQVHHLRFADDIVLITPSITQAERMLANFDHACGKIGLQLNSECSSYVHLDRKVNMTNDLSSELGRRKGAAWGAYKSVEVVRRTKNARLRAHLFDSTVLPALTYASESWTLRKQDGHAICVAQGSIERRMLGVTRFVQARDGIRSSELRRQSKIRDAVAWAKLSKIRWAGHVMRFRNDRWTRAVTDWIPRDVRRTPDRLLFCRVPRASRTNWSTLARDRNKWRHY
ncbi:hypothetical protein Q1695_007305 [Nippostrongylus brasiliensis]|nr:hypothetical protein Q1695_007305 [Nippostrongylus brasiliensis]